MSIVFKLIMLAISAAIGLVFLVGGIVAITGFKEILEKAIG